MNANNSDLSKKVARLIIKEITEQGGFDRNVVAHIVNNHDLENEFLGEGVANLIKRVKILERDFPQFRG